MNPTDGVVVVIAGVERELRYSLGSMRRLKKELGKSVLNPMQDVDEDRIAGLLYEGLRDSAGNPPADLTLDQMCDSIRPGDLKYLMEQFAKAWLAGQLPEGELKNGPSAAPMIQ